MDQPVRSINTGGVLGGYSGADPYLPVCVADGEESQTALVRSRMDLGDLLLAEGIITPEQLTSVRNVISKSPGRKLADVFFEMDVDQVKMQACVANLAGLRFERLAFDALQALDQLEVLGGDYCLRHGVMPIRRKGARLVVGLVHTEDLITVEEVQAKLGKTVKAVVVTPQDIARGGRGVPRARLRIQRGRGR